jgi:hypothetical protein
VVREFLRTHFVDVAVLDDDRGDFFVCSQRLDLDAQGRPRVPRSNSSAAGQLQR